MDFGDERRNVRGTQVYIYPKKNKEEMKKQDKRGKQGKINGN